MGLNTRMKLHNPTAQQVHDINEWIKKRHLHDLKYPEYNVFLLEEDGHAYFDSLWRYWSPDYQRGPWPKIHAIMRKASHMGLELYYTSDDYTEWDRVDLALMAHCWRYYLNEGV